jgi:hypothetical protein
MKPEDQIKLLREALEAFEREEFRTKADWLGLCAFRRSDVRCRGTDGHNSAVGTPKPTPHSEHCPYSGLRRALEATKPGVEGNHKLPTNSAPDAETREARTIYTAETVPLEGVPGPNVPFFWMVCAECRHRFPPGAAHRCARPSPKDEDR